MLTIWSHRFEVRARRNEGFVPMAHSRGATPQCFEDRTPRRARSLLGCNYVAHCSRSSTTQHSSLLVSLQNHIWQMVNIFLRHLRKSKFFWLIIVFVIVFFSMVSFLKMRKKTDQLVTLRVRKQNLVISVLEGGNLQALRSQNVIDNVPGQRTILEVVEEGTLITEQDVKDGKILVKLDSKDLKDKADQLDIEVENGWASYMEAQENFKIQKKQNETDIRKAEIDVKFARMDLDKYIGVKLAEELIKQGIGNVSKLINRTELAGEAVNRKSELENKIDIAMEEVARAQDKVNWSDRLASKGYITQDEMKADKLFLKQKEVGLEQARLEYALFIKYDFAKQVEKYVSDYNEAGNDSGITKDKAKSKLIQVESNVKSKKASYESRKNQLEETNLRIDQCVIKAIQPGFVVYGGSGRPWSTQNPIQPGTNIRQFQQILSLPDFASMGVEIKVHESAIEKVKLGQKSIVKVDAFPKNVFYGKVSKVAVMPDNTLKWMNPDINVYNTQISLDGQSDFLKPGMSAQVEIVIETLYDVLTVPLIAVFFDKDKPFCSVLRGRKIQNVSVTLGKSNNEMIVVSKGLMEGDIVVILPNKSAVSQVRKKERVESGTVEKKRKPKQ